MMAFKPREALFLVNTITASVDTEQACSAPECAAFGTEANAWITQFRSPKLEPPSSFSFNPCAWRARPKVVACP
jgi:hypothetical protein